MSQTPGDQDPTTASSGNLTLTLTPGYACGMDNGGHAVNGA